LGNVCEEAGRERRGKVYSDTQNPLFAMKLNSSIYLHTVPIQQIDGNMRDVSGLAGKKSHFL